MFSPYYAWQRRRGAAEAGRHCAVNVALYGPRHRWAMTERREARAEADSLSIGHSALRWDGGTLCIDIDEVTAPLPSRLRGTVRLHPASVETAVHTLDAPGRHRWRPIAPCARVEVALQRPSLRWSGPGYLDTNDGDRPLERDFVRWDWSRAVVPGGTAVLYDAQLRDGGRLSLALDHRANGGAGRFAPPPEVELPANLWGVRRATRSEEPARVLKTLESAPFYARSIVAGRLLGANVVAMHESLSLDRFASPWVQAMLPFRMPRWG